MTVLSAKNTPRNSYTATGGQTAFTIGFEFFAIADVKVFKNATLMTYNADPTTTTTYKITGITNTSDEAYEFGNGGTVTFGSGLTAGDEVVIIRDIVVERTSDFNPAGAFDITTLNTQLDTIISMIADTQTQTDRSVKLLDTDTVSATVTLPAKATRASKVLAFDSDGNAETTLSTANLSTLGGITTEISTVAGISSNVTTTAGISSNVTTVAGNDSNITTVAGVSGNITTVAGISSNVTTVAGISSAVSTVASANSNISTVASGISNINTVASGISNVNTVAGSISNVNTVASNVSGVNSFAERYRVGSSDPSSSLDAGDLFFNTTSNTLKFYDSSSWNVIASTFTIDGASDTNLTSPADGALLLYDTGTSKFIDNVVSGDATLADTGVLTIADDAVTYAKIQNVSATDRILGRDSAGAGVIEEITPANLRTMINVADGANAYTHPNHSGEVTSTADGATVIADNVVDEANLKVSNSPVNGYMLTAQSGASGGLTWAEAPSGGGFSLASALSGTTPTIDWSSATAFSQTLAANTTYSFSNVPSGGEIELFLKNVGKTHDFLSLNAATNEDFDGQKGTERIKGSLFNNDGTKFYLAGEDANYSIHQYSLSTAYDVSTASYDSKVSPSFASSIRIHGLHFNGDGTALIAARGNDLYEYTLTGAYDISTVSGTANHSIVMDTPLSLDSSAHAYFVNIRFNADGTLAYLGNMRHSGQSSYATTKSGFIISLSTAYDIDSTLTLLSTFDYGADEYFKTAASNVYSDIAYDGTAIVAVEETVASGVSRVHKYYLTTPWDLSTASHIGSADITTANSNATNIYNVRTTPDGKFFFYNEYQAGNADNAIVRNYDIVGNFEAVLPSSVSSLPATFGDGPDPSTTSYLRMVSLDGSNVLITDHKEIV